MTYGWADAVGNLGVLLVLASYLGLQLDRIDGQGVAYSACNAVGAVLLLVSLTVNFNLSSVIIEIFWLAISAVGLWRGWRRRAGRPGGAE
ncbi:MAG: CBU_0592 family membrane protein [Gammaproteobacteria bacterium]